MSTYYWVGRTLTMSLAHAVWRPTILGNEHVPRSGGVLLASNHLSFIDSVFLPLVIERNMVFLAKSDYFTGKGLKGWATKLFFTATGMLPIDRSGGKVDVGVPLVSLLSWFVPDFAADALPPELAALPPVKPGSRGIQGAKA